MSTSEPDLETNSSETTTPKLDWCAPRTWAFFVADAAYSGAVIGLIVIVACLITGLFYEMKTGSFDGWWLVSIVMVLLLVIHHVIFDRWLLSGKSARRFDFDQVLPSDGNGAKLGSFFYGFGMAGAMSLVPPAQRLLLSSLHYGLRIGAGIILVLVAHRLTALSVDRETILMAVVIFSMFNNESTLLRLLAYRTPNNLDS